MSDIEFGVVPGGRAFPERAVYDGIKLVIFDVDGTLTDGRIILDAQGNESKFFNVRDGAGITFLHAAGLLTALITGRSSPVVDFRAAELKIPRQRVKQGAKVKLPVFQELLAELGVSAGETAFVGDDIIDLPLIEAAGLACAPSDAHAEIVSRCHVVARRPAGHGAVREIIEHLLKQRSDKVWDRALNRYLGRA